MRYYMCTFLELVHHSDDTYKAKIILISDDLDRGYFANDTLKTSAIKSIDFEAGVIITQNSVYLFK